MRTSFIAAAAAAFLAAMTCPTATAISLLDTVKKEKPHQRPNKPIKDELTDAELEELMIL